MVAQCNVSSSWKQTHASQSSRPHSAGRLLNKLSSGSFTMIMAFLSTPSLNSFPPSPIGVSATWRGNHLGPPHPQEKEAHGVDIGPSVKRLLEKEDPSLPSSGFAIPTLFKKCLLPSSPGRSTWRASTRESLCWSTPTSFSPPVTASSLQVSWRAIRDWELLVVMKRSPGMMIFSWKFSACGRMEGRGHGKEVLEISTRDYFTEWISGKLDGNKFSLALSIILVLIFCCIRRVRHCPTFLQRNLAWAFHTLHCFRAKLRMTMCEHKYKYL